MYVYRFMQRKKTQQCKTDTHHCSLAQSISTAYAHSAQPTNAVHTRTHISTNPHHRAAHRPTTPPYPRAPATCSPAGTTSYPAAAQVRGERRRLVERLMLVRVRGGESRPSRCSSSASAAAASAASRGPGRHGRGATRSLNRNVPVARNKYEN